MLRENAIVCGPTQRLPAAAVLPGWGKALTSISIRHVFPLQGAPFFFGFVPILVRWAPTEVPSVQV